MKISNFKARVRELLSIKTPLIWIITREEEQAEKAIVHEALADETVKYFYFVTDTGGGQMDPFTLRQANGSSVNSLDEALHETEQEFEYPERVASPTALFQLMEQCPDNVMAILRNASDVFNDPATQRGIRDIVDRKIHNKKVYVPIVMISPSNVVPEPIRDITVSLELPLLTEEEDKVLLSKIVKQNDLDANPGELARAASGLTTHQIMQAVKDSMHRTGTIEADALNKERIAIVQQSNVLTYVEPKKTMESVGGHGRLKNWLKEVKLCMTPEAQKFHVQMSKGYLALGQAGAGKTAMAEAVANYFGVPLLIFDVSRMMGGIVGQSEQTARRAFETIQAVGSCVVLMDEIDKGAAGVADNSTTQDGGTIARVFSVILQNLQENSKQFYILTANDVSKIPAALLRPGRIDRKWYFDFPQEDDRKGIFNIYLKKAEQALDDELLTYAAKMSEHFTGAEIETAVNNIIRIAFLGDKKITKDVILRGIEEVTPTYKTNNDEVVKLQEYAQKNGIPSTAETEKKIDITGDQKAQKRLGHMNSFFEGTYGKAE